MIIYLLKMIACSAAFYALYHFFFSKEKMLVFNRFYLLASLIASFIIPLITFTVYISASLAPVEVYPINETVVNMVAEPVVTKPDYLLWISLTIAVVITLILFIRFIKNLLRLRNSIVQSEKIKFENAQLVLVEKETVPFSFMQNIFINKNEYEQGRVADAVIAHEMAHIQQKHSWDILFVEILQVFNWFNPALFLYKRAIKTNHEFLADEAVVQQTADRLHYQQLLLQMVYVNNNIPLASSFYFTTKKRLIMLQKTFKRKRAVWAGMAAVPLLVLLVFIFSSRTYAQVEKPKIENVTVTDFPQTSAVPHNVLSTEIHYDKNNKPLTAGIEYKDGTIVQEDISTSEKQKDFEKKYNLRVVAGTPPMLEYKTDSYSVTAKMIINRSLKDVLLNDTTPPKVEMRAYVPSPSDKKEQKSFRPPLIVNNKTGEKGISKEEMKEYESILKEMAVKKSGRTYYKFIDGKTQVAVDIYKRMSAAQRKTATPLPPPPPPSKKIEKSFSPPVIIKNDDEVQSGAQSKLEEYIVIPVAESITAIDKQALPKNVNSIDFIRKSEWGDYVALVIFKDKTYKKENISTPEDQNRFEKRYNVKISK